MNSKVLYRLEDVVLRQINFLVSQHAIVFTYCIVCIVSIQLFGCNTNKRLFHFLTKDPHRPEAVALLSKKIWPLGTPHLLWRTCSDQHASAADWPVGLHTTCPANRLYSAILRQRNDNRNKLRYRHIKYHKVV